MNKDQVLEAVKKMPRQERDEVLETIIQANSNEGAKISIEQEKELERRLLEIDTGQVHLVDGEDVMVKMAKKYNI